MPPPKKPISAHEGDMALSREIWLQCRDGLIAILANNYDWKGGRLFQALHISDSSSLGTRERFFRISLSGKGLPEKDLVDISVALTSFERNVIEAMGQWDQIAIVPSTVPDILTISYSEDRTYRLLNNMVAMHHPEDMEAQGHLLMACHMIERLSHKRPANSLC